MSPFSPLNLPVAESRPDLTRALSAYICRNQQSAMFTTVVGALQGQLKRIAMPVALTERCNAISVPNNKDVLDELDILGD